MKMEEVIIALLLTTLMLTCDCYKPVIMMHGFSFSNDQASYHDFDDIVSWLNRDHPGQITIALDINCGRNSTHALWEQLPQIQELIESIVANNESFADGYHWIGHSQGGLIMRCLLETMDHNVDQFLSLAGVQGGFYGIPDVPPKWNIENKTAEEITKLMYSDWFQNEFSVADYWRSPDEDYFISENIFLPYLNNQVEDSFNQEYKLNFIKVNNITLFGSPLDGFITPWYSTQFEFYDEDFNRLLLQQQPYYVDNTFGLRTLVTEGRLSRIVLDNVQHAEWLHTESIYQEYYLPILY